MNHMIQRLVDKQRNDEGSSNNENSKEVNADLTYLREEVTVLRKAMGSDHQQQSGVERVKLPEPKAFDGSRDSKTLENFIWDLEHYFKVSKRKDNAKVDIAALYLTGDAKLWWRSRTEGDRAAEKEPITTWDEMKAELRRQFLPNNAAWVARDKLRELRHNGSIREYVKEFMSLMLDIDGMSEKDKLFSFISGLKPWAQTELRRSKAEDLTTAIAAAEALVDWKPKGEKDADKGKGKANESGTKRKFGKFKGKKKGGFKQWNKDSNEEKGDKKDEASTSKKPKYEGGCFICKGPHFARNCPKRQTLSAITSEQDADLKMDEDTVAPTLNNMRLLNAMNADDASVDGLLYCKVNINGNEEVAMLDTGASHNFSKAEVARKLGLSTKPTNHALKAVNSAASKAVGLITDVNLKVGPWNGKVDLLAISMDDYDLVLGNKFFRKAIRLRYRIKLLHCWRNMRN